MAEPFLGEIRLCSFVFAPKGWALCNGQLLPINQNQGLFSLLGTTYGGDGQVNFALPDMRARRPIHEGQGYTRGQKGGEAAHTLTLAELPAHNHVMRASGNTGTQVTPTSGYLAASAVDLPFAVPGANPLSSVPNVLNNAGGSQAHLNLPPFLTLNFVIALQGIFPSQT